MIMGANGPMGTSWHLVLMADKLHLTPIGDPSRTISFYTVTLIEQMVEDASQECTWTKIDAKSNEDVRKSI